MGSARLDLDADIVALLEGKDRPIQQAARELIVLELHREGQLSGGRPAEILHLSREDFIRFASERGIPYFQLDGDELRREVDTSESL
jgi:predicted HTH domain antitoxin